MQLWFRNDQYLSRMISYHMSCGFTSIWTWVMVRVEIISDSTWRPMLSHIGNKKKKVWHRAEKSCYQQWKSSIRFAQRMQYVGIFLPLQNYFRLHCLLPKSRFYHFLKFKKQQQLSCNCTLQMASFDWCFYVKLCCCGDLVILIAWLTSPHANVPPKQRLPWHCFGKVLLPHPGRAAQVERNLIKEI